MPGRRRSVLLAALLAVLALTTTSLLHSRHSAAQSSQSGIVFYDVGSQTVSGSSWNFSGDFQITAGAWESITITNYGYCFAGPNDPRAGTAHAGGVFWFTELQASPPTNSGYTYTAKLKPGRGGNTDGTVTVTTNGDPSNPNTHVDVSLSGSDLNFYQDNTLDVCLLGSS